MSIGSRVKNTILSVAFLFLFPAAGFAQAPQVTQKSLPDGASQPYIVQLPSKYSPEKKYPLFIAVHGHMGTAQQLLEEWKFLANKAGYILLCPQFSDGYQGLSNGEGETLVKIIEATKREYSVDAGKVFLVGCSGGAQFAHRFAFRYPGYASAACILAAGSYSQPSDPSAKSVKYYVGVGQEDERYQRTLLFYEQLEKRGYDVTFQAFPRVGHTLHSSMKRAVMEFLGNF